MKTKIHSRFVTSTPLLNKGTIIVSSTAKYRWEYHRVAFAALKKNGSVVTWGGHYLDLELNGSSKPLGSAGDRQVRWLEAEG